MTQGFIHKSTCEDSQLGTLKPVKYLKPLRPIHFLVGSTSPLHAPIMGLPMGNFTRDIPFRQAQSNPEEFRRGRPLRSL